MEKVINKDYKLGIKSGIFTGLVYGFLYFLYTLFIMFFLPKLTSDLVGIYQGIGVGKEFVYVLYFLLVPLFIAGFSAVGALVYGVIFTWLINKLPTNSIYVKSLILTLILWIFIPLPFGLLIVLLSPKEKFGLFLTSIFLYLIFTLIFSSIYTKLLKKQHQQLPPNSNY